MCRASSLRSEQKVGSHTNMQARVVTKAVPEEIPARGRAGQTVAAINVSAQAPRVPAKTLVQDYLPVLRRAAETIERLLKAR